MRKRTAVGVIAVRPVEQVRRSGTAPGITDACFARDTFGFRCVRRLSPRELETIGESPSGSRSAGK